MKTKFDETAVSEAPKTGSSTEPALPWQLRDDDEALADRTGTSGRFALAGTAHPRASVVLIVLLIIAIFAFISNTITNMAIDKYAAESDSIQRGEMVSSLKINLVKTAGEKAVLSEDASRLEKQVSDLNAQKELYTAVLETLAKKPDDVNSVAGNSQNPQQ